MLLGPRVRQAGVSLAEMLTVVAVLSVAAVIAIPQASSLSPAAAEAAAAEVARALRFAQREAIRTGSYQAVSIDPATQLLRVYLPISPAGATTLHPVDKRGYQISFAGNTMPQARIVSSVFTYEDKAVANHVTFAPDGVPVDPDSGPVQVQILGQLLGEKDASPLKEEGKITIRHGNVERVVRVAPLTGRVTF